MYRIIGPLITALLVLSSTPILAQPPPVDVLSGRWTYDAARSHELTPDMRISRTATGSLRTEGGSGPSYDFDLVGGSHPLSNGRTIAWLATARNAWLVTRKKNGEAIDTTAVTLSGNSLRSALRGKLPDGSPYERTISYQRQGAGEGLVGVWRSTKVDTGATWDGFVISSTADGVVTWRIPTDLQVITGHFDGSDLPIIGPSGPTGSTMAFRQAGPRRFTYLAKSGGQISERGFITLSRDGTWLTELSWSVDAPERKSTIVYRRDNDPKN